MLKQNLIYSIILFVTNKCNGSCEGCLYKSKLNNRYQDMDLETIQRLAKDLDIWHLQISGGEPFLRDDLYDICTSFIKYSKTKIISIPTNGILKVKILDFVKRISSMPNNYFVISISLDGTKDMNNKIRGHGYDLSFDTLKKLLLIEKNLKNLKIYVSTRVTKQNISDIPQLVKELKSIGVKRHNIFPIRGELNDGSQKIPSAEEYKGLMKNLGRRLNPIDNLNIYMLKGNLLPFSCVAGEKLGVVDSDGDIRLCELLPPIGNLKDNGGNFYKVWNSISANKQRELIKKLKCSKGCTHGCFLGPSLLKSPLSIMRFLY